MVRFDTGEGVVLEEDSQDGEIIARVAALDIGKAELGCCVRVPHEGKPGRRLQEVATYSTMTGTVALSDRPTGAKPVAGVDAGGRRLRCLVCHGSTRSLKGVRSRCRAWRGRL